jgi:hypothetical protein
MLSTCYSSPILYHIAKSRKDSNFVAFSVVNRCFGFLVVLLSITCNATSKSANKCDNILEMFRYPLSEHQNPSLVQINYDTNGNSDFNIQAIINNPSPFTVAFNVKGKISESKIQEFIPTQRLFDTEKSQLKKMLDYLKSSEFLEGLIAEKIQFYGMLEEDGLDPITYKQVKEPNPNWQSDQKLISNLRKKALKEVDTNDIEVGFFIAIGESGKILFSPHFFTSYESSAIRHGDSGPSLELINQEFGEESIVEVHYYHLHPKGTPLSPADTDQLTTSYLYQSSGYTNLNYHIYAVVLDSNKENLVGLFHHSYRIP